MIVDLECQAVVIMVRMILRGRTMINATVIL